MNKLLRHTVLAAGLAMSLGAPASAQGTTGVPGFNDYTINTLGSGAASCSLLVVPAGPAVFNLSTAPGVAAVILFNLNCPCLPCVLPWAPAVGCTAVPPMVCMPSTNHGYDLNSGLTPCALVAIGGLVADGLGNATLPLVLPATPPPYRFSTQAISLHPCASGSSGLLFSQAFDVSVP